jgi:hypothetical protein
VSRSPQPPGSATCSHVAKGLEGERTPAGFLPPSLEPEAGTMTGRERLEKIHECDGERVYWRRQG